MSARRIDELIWMAFTDTAFCERLLNGQRREILATLSLSEMERQAILSVQADTLESFAGALSQPGFCAA